MSSKLLSIIIVNYESWRDMRKCLTSVYNKLSRGIDFEIIIVNNDKNEKLGDVRRDFPQIRIIDRGKNIGFGAGNNLGAKYANGKIILFLNSDTEILSGNIFEVLSQFNDNSQLGAAGAQLITEKGFIQDWGAGYETGFWDIIRNNLKIPRSREIWKSEKEVYSDWVSGAAFFIKKETFEKIGGFDENFFMYFEDMDICERIRKSGKKILYFPRFKVKHRGGENFRDKKEQKKNFYNSQEYYFRKHRGVFQSRILKFFRAIFEL